MRKSGEPGEGSQRENNHFNQGKIPEKFSLQTLTDFIGVQKDAPSKFYGPAMPESIF